MQNFTTTTAMANATDRWLTGTSHTSQPLTTPFVQTGSCASLFTTITFTTATQFGSESTIDAVITATVSDWRNSKFLDCQPSGWVTAAADWIYYAENGIGPAVCPSGWNGYAFNPGYAADVATIAVCCASGYSYMSEHVPMWMSLPPREEKYFGYCQQNLAEDYTSLTETKTQTDWFRGHKLTAATRTETLTASMTASWSASIRVHNAWTITWAERDVFGMTPAPPMVGCSESTYPTWTPSQVFPPCPIQSWDSSAYEPPTKGLSSYSVAMVCLFTILGSIVFLVFACFCVCANKRYQRERKLKEVGGAVTEQYSMRRLRSHGSARTSMTLDSAQDLPPYEREPQRPQNVATNDGEMAARNSSREADATMPPPYATA